MKMEKQETAKTIAGHDVKRVHEKISDYLVRSEYDYICVINTQTGMLYVDTDELHADWDWTGEEHDYYDARALLVETFLDDNDGKDFMHCSEIPYIVKQLEEQKVYSFMFHFSTPEQETMEVFLSGSGRWFDPYDLKGCDKTPRTGSSDRRVEPIWLYPKGKSRSAGSCRRP